MQTSLPTPKQDKVRWLCGLHELARTWIASEPSVNATAAHCAYVDLTFAFALASIGASDESEELSRRAIGDVGGLDDAHLMLQQLYGYRIAQARQGQPHVGMIPNEISTELDNLHRLFRYNVDRLLSIPTFWNRISESILSGIGAVSSRTIELSSTA